MVKHIIHLADLHIPNDEKARPYMTMLKKCLAEILKTVKPYKQDEIRIVVVGDIFHNKIKASNEAKKMFHETLNYLNAIGKTIIVAGNHDMLENNQERIDSISPTFDIKDVYPNVTYIDRKLDFKSGFIKDENIIWALYSMYDRFARPNIDGLKEKCPDCKIVGLIHGDINGAKTDAGYTSENALVKDMFNGCDCVMAGHIHKFQTLYLGETPIVYSSSVFQQNTGENVSGHGFVLWDMEALSYKLIEVKNDYAIYHFKIKDYEDVKNDKEILTNQ